MTIAIPSSKVHHHYGLAVFIWVLAGCFFLYEFFIRAFMGSIAIPYQIDLNISPAEFSLIASAYYMAYSPMQIPVGLLMDRFGARFLLSVGAFFCSIGTIIFSQTLHFDAAWCGRFLMGLGSSVAFISLLTLALNWFPKRFFGFFAGLTQTLGTIGPILSGAPLAYWMLATHNNWPLILLYIGLIGFALTLILALFVRNHPKNRVEKKAEAALSLWQTLKELLSICAARRIALYALCIYAAIPLIGEVWGTPYLEARGFSLTEATGMVASLWIGMGIGNPIVGLISDALARRKLILGLSALLGMLSTLLFVFINAHSTLFYSILLFAIGVAASGQTLSFAIMAESVPHYMKSTAMGFNNFAVMLGGIFSQMIAGLILNHFWGEEARNIEGLSISAYQYALTCSAVFFLLSLVLCFILKETYAKSRE